MHRVTICALAVLGTLSVAACDQYGTGSKASDGVYFALNGQLAPPSLGARLTFYNNEKGTHQATLEAQAEASVIPAGTSMTIPGQPAQSSVSGQPSVSLQLVDGSGRPLTGEVQLGACGGVAALPRRPARGGVGGPPRSSLRLGGGGAPPWPGEPWRGFGRGPCPPRHKRPAGL